LFGLKKAVDKNCDLFCVMHYKIFQHLPTKRRMEVKPAAILSK
jgi:hypothetical protein